MPRRFPAACLVVAVLLVSAPVSALMVGDDHLRWGDPPMYSSNGEYYLSMVGILPGWGSCTLPGWIWVTWNTSSGGNIPNYPAPQWNSLYDGDNLGLGLGKHRGQYGCKGVDLVMQDDGNLVFYADEADTVPVWDTQTYTHPGSYLNLQDDGNLVLYDQDGIAWWSMWP